MVWHLSKNSIENREGVNHKLIEISDLALTISPIDFGHPRDGGLRTCERQHELFLEGVSLCDGYDNISRHQTGEALDFYAFVNGKASWDREHLAVVAASFMQAAMVLDYRIIWGGLFAPFEKHDGKDYPSGWDYPHIELIE